ncbi:hypothetical protein ACJX0J_040370, partial [Zea mays]
ICALAQNVKSRPIFGHIPFVQNWEAINFQHLFNACARLWSNKMTMELHNFLYILVLVAAKRMLTTQFGIIAVTNLAHLHHLLVLGGLNMLTRLFFGYFKTKCVYIFDWNF